MRDTRVLGNNINLLLNQKGITKEDFASALGYSVFDVQKLCDARLSTSKADLQDIARFLQVDESSLFTDLGEKAYVGDGFMHCMGEFKSKANKNKILDIFDMYCDMQELLNMNE